MTDSALVSNWFDRGGHAYATFRPDYPDAIATYLATIAPDRELAVDVGCGSGQLTGKLAQHFRKVIGVDPSASQLAHAVSDVRIDYLCAPAESLPLSDASASLVSVAQAAHWFDLPKFYAEVRRIARPGAAIALVSYGAPRFADPALQDRFQHFHWKEMGPYWPAERRLVDSGYSDIDFPFAELETPSLSIDRLWGLPELLGYVSTWSAVRRAAEAENAEIFQRFADDLRALWGEPDISREISWPIAIRAGTIR